MSDDREPTIAELCRPLSAKVQPKGAIAVRLGHELTEAQREAYVRLVARYGRRSGAHV